MKASRLRHVRLDAGLIQLVLAGRVRISPSRYSLIERGLVEPSPDEQQRLAAALGTTVRSLFRAQQDHPDGTK